MENVERLAELSNCVDAVHRHPMNSYQHFVNAFVYVKNSYGRQDAVRKAQEFWKVESDEKKDCILKETFRKLEMTKKRKITWLFKTAFSAYAFGKGAGGREKAYVSYACENAEKYGRSLTLNEQGAVVPLKSKNSTSVHS